MIVKSAIKFPTGNIYIGKRHCDCFHEAHLAGEKTKVREIQGFITDKGEFLDRIEGAKYAIECGQIKKTKWGKRLFSEDLW